VNRRVASFGLSVRFVALGLALALTSSTLLGCSRGTPPPPVDDTQGGRSSYPTQPQRRGMSTGQKLALLAGAAALYYLYNKQKNARGTGPTGQLYRSKNGRVYYRDKDGRAHWVTPPPGGIRVPADEAQQYSGYQGYNGQASGETFGGFGASNQPLSPMSSPPGPGG
jgi:hypothetical protein